MGGEGVKKWIDDLTVYGPDPDDDLTAMNDDGRDVTVVVDDDGRDLTIHGNFCHDIQKAIFASFAFF